MADTTDLTVLMVTSVHGDRDRLGTNWLAAMAYNGSQHNETVLPTIFKNDKTV